MSENKPRQETLAALEAMFSPVMSKDAMSGHLSLIATGAILALRQIESDEFVRDFLQAAIDAIDQEDAYATGLIKVVRQH